MFEWVCRRHPYTDSVAIGLFNYQYIIFSTEANTYHITQIQNIPSGSSVATVLADDGLLLDTKHS